MFIRPMMLSVLMVACGSTDPQPSPPPAPAAERAAPAKAAPAAKVAIPERKSDAERASKNGHVQATIHGVDVDVRFGRPNQKGREVLGGLVPYDQVWRTGADEASTFTVSKAIQFGALKVPAGTYALFTIPGKTDWTIVLNSVAGQWGAYDYDATKDVGRMKVQPTQHAPTETFDIQATDMGLVLLWDDWAVPVPIQPAG